MNNNYPFQDDDEECATILDTLFPYLFLGSFLLGIFLMRIVKFFGLKTNKNDDSNSNSNKKIEFLSSNEKIANEEKF